MRALKIAGLFSLSMLVFGCTQQGRAQFPSVSPLGLSRVVLYRNGVGYFERSGEIDGDLLRIKVRKDQVNDLLKSLTIVDRQTGRAVSVSMPLDPETWANAALATLAPGRGSLAEVLDMLRGADVVLDTVGGSLQGRIVMVEAIEDEPDPAMPRPARGESTALGRDHKVTLMDGNELRIVLLSKVRGVTLTDGDLAMQFHRRLDATAGEGMFQQVEVAIRLDNADSHDLVVSYVVESPMWKPTYRVVLPEGGKGEALLQAWAVVDNVSGEDWRDVKLALTAGAPIAFRYDLHTPRRVFREDLSETGTARRARVAMGETTFSGDEEAEDAPMPEPVEAAAYDKLEEMANLRGPMGGAAGPMAPPPPPKPASRARRSTGKKGDEGYYERDDDGAPAEDSRAITLEGLRRSTLAQARASQASGLTRFDIHDPVTVPDGSATMVAIVNQAVQGEEAFLYDPRGGGGSGYENNPYRVVRFKNTTPFVLEPGPISIYSGGSFVGEGISQVVGAKTSATIPFAVEPGIMVTRETPSIPQELKLLKVVRGVFHVSRFHRVKTIWQVKAQTKNDGFKILIRHPKYGVGYTLKDPPAGMEELPDAFLVPIEVAAGKKTGSVELVEQTPAQTTVGIWDSGFLEMIERAMVAEGLSPAERQKLQPIVDLRRQIGKIDSEMDSLRRREDVLNRRIEQHRNNLRRLKDMKGAEAERMRQERAVQLEAFTREGDGIAREILTLEEKREQKVIELEDKLETLTIEAK